MMQSREWMGNTQDGDRCELWMSHIVDIVCHPSQVLDIAARVCAALSR